MSNNDKLLLICLLGATISMATLAYLCYMDGYKRGKREGYARGRNVARQRYWSE